MLVMFTLLTCALAVNIIYMAFTEEADPLRMIAAAAGAPGTVHAVAQYAQLSTTPGGG